jgi:hypothetical protein
MKNLLMAALVFSLAGAVSAQTPAPAAATTAADVTGTWNATFSTANGEIPAQIKLTKTGAKITGTISSQLGESTLEAEQKDKAVSIWFSMAGQNGAMAIELAATLDGDTMKGSTSAAGSPAGEWIATRAKPDAAAAKTAAPTTATAAPAPASLTGSWNVSLELPNISATSTMVLKQDGEKLTGEYVSQQYGKFPLTGTVKGSDVTISYALNIEGNAMNVNYAGKIDKDGNIAGTVNIGDMMNGTFTSVRQK